MNYQVNVMGCWISSEPGKLSRMAYTLKYGKIPRGMTIHRACDPNCINPDHAVLVPCRNKSLERNKLVGSKNGTAKLNEDKVRKIRKAFMDNPNLSYYRVGKKYGVHESAIRQIVLNKTWKHITI